MSRNPLGERFADSRGEPISYRGLTVHSIHEITVAAGTGLVVRFVRSVSGSGRALDWP